MRTLLLALTLTCTVAAEEPTSPKDEIQDPAALSPAQRQERMLSCLQLLERFPEGNAVGTFVGPLLMFRAGLRGDLAERAARVLKTVTGEDFGKDFDKWQTWYEGVKKTEKWAPAKIYRTLQNPKEVLEGPEILLVWSPEPPKDMGKGTKVLKAPIALRCPRLGLYLAASDDLEVRWDSDRGQVALKCASEFIISGSVGTRGGFLRTKEAVYDLFCVIGFEYVSSADLGKIPQEVADAKIDDPDASVVMRYVCEQAQMGNFLPGLRVLGERSLRKLAEPEERKDLAKKLGLSEEECAKLSAEEMLLAWMRQDYAKHDFLYLDVTVRPARNGEGLHYHMERFGGSSGGSLEKRDSKWRARN